MKRNLHKTQARRFIYKKEIFEVRKMAVRSLHNGRKLLRRNNFLPLCKLSLAWRSMYKDTDTFAYTACTQMYLFPCTWIIMLEISHIYLCHVVQIIFSIHCLLSIHILQFRSCLLWYGSPHIHPSYFCSIVPFWGRFRCTPTHTCVICRNVSLINI